MQLPEEYTDRMRQILGEEYAAFEESYSQPRHHGLRVNTMKISVEEFVRIAPFHLTPIPWIPEGFYYLEEDHPARHPFYQAGLYYLQEPTAMTPASVFEIRPGERVLDLCAAPGGKATALGAKLQGQGLLVANDISASRARALLKNLETFGITNSFVTNAVPARLAQQFPLFFDKILLDAPCSGEGMFRKDEDTIRAWYPEKPAECAAIQRSLILAAADMLRPGGRLLYSTCTFAPQEDEEVIAFLLGERRDMRLTGIPGREGFSDSLEPVKGCVRLWPHRMGGEGHFMALLEKDGCLLKQKEPKNTGKEKDSRQKGAGQKRGQKKGVKGYPDEKGSTALVEAFFKDTGIRLGQKTLFPEGRHLEIRSDMAYLVSELLPEVSGIPFLRNGLFLGECKKNRFEPSQPLALALNLARCERTAILSLHKDDERLQRYLHGEAVELTMEEAAAGNGWKLLCVEEYPIGWGKQTGSLLKNHYPAGWRSKY